MFKATLLIDNGDLVIGDYRYVKLDILDDIKKFKKYDFNCILVKYLRPEFIILLPRIDLIITENGGQLSHLAIVAAMSRKAIIWSDSICEKTNKNRGFLNILKKSKDLYVKLN